MPALYTITTRASGTILTAAIYNTDHQNHVNNGDAQHLGGFSANTSQMRTQTSPGDVGSESLSLSISDELARIRYMIALQRGTTFWYGTAASYSGSSTGNYLRNSNFLVAQRMGQAAFTYSASAGSPYTFDQWYMVNGVNQTTTVNYGVPLYSNDVVSMGIQRFAGQTGIAAMWVGQPFTLAQLAPLRGKQVTASITFTTGANWSAPQIQLVVVVGTGTACKFSAGFTSSTFPINTIQSTTPSMGVTRIQGTGVIPVNATQLEFYVPWTPIGTAGAADSISFAQAKLELGAQATPYIPPDPYVELQELSAWYWKTFDLGVLPATNAGQNGAVFMPQTTALSLINYGNHIRWPTRMIKPPTVTLFNPQAANAQARNTVATQDCSATAVGVIGEGGCYINYTSSAGSAAGHANVIHLTAEAGL